MEDVKQTQQDVNRSTQILEDLTEDLSINGESKKVIPYIYANKEWHIAKGYIGNKEFNGE